MASIGTRDSLPHSAKEGGSSFWLIQHLSWAEVQSVNDFISEELAYVSHSSVDVALGMVLEVGVVASMVKNDIKSAFRLLPVHQDD